MAGARERLPALRMETVPVRCGALEGVFVVRDAVVEHKPGGKAARLLPQEFEAVAGRQAARKWKSSIRVREVPEYEGMEIGAFLRQVQGVDINRGVLEPYSAPQAGGKGAASQAHSATPQEAANKLCCQLLGGQKNSVQVVYGQAAKGSRSVLHVADLSYSQLMWLSRISGAKKAFDTSLLKGEPPGVKLSKVSFVSNNRGDLTGPPELLAKRKAILDAAKAARGGRASKDVAVGASSHAKQTRAAAAEAAPQGPS